MNPVFKHLRTSALSGMLAAAVGFSYALATSSAPEASGEMAVGARGTNHRQPLTFTNPFVTGSTDRDLGDAAIGSQLLRYIRAKGGVPPHRFVSDRNFQGDDGKPLFIGTQTLLEAEATLPPTAKPSLSTATVFLNGLLKGQIGGAGGTVADGTPLRFDVTVGDSGGTSANKHDEVFRITLVDPNIFKFSQSTLSEGTTFRRYYDKVEVVAGIGQKTFTVTKITINGAADATVTKLEDIGLFLNKHTGVISGRPLKAGVIGLTLDCTDSTGAHALARNKVGVGQTISFNVIQATRVSSELFSTKMSIKGDTNGGNKDTLQYSGLLDLAGKQVSDLNGLIVVLQIGDYTSPPVTITNGKGSTGDKKSKSATVKLTNDGVLTIAVKNDTFGKDQTIVNNGQLATTVPLIFDVQVMIGDANGVNTYSSDELLRFSVKAKSGKFDLEYKFGPGNLGGGFIITQVTGKDNQKTSPTGDSWKVSFICLPPNDQKLASFGSITTATVGIGSDFGGDIPVSLIKDKVKSTGKGDPKTATVVSFGFDSKSGKGATVTGVLPQLSPLPNIQTQIPPALSAGGKSTKFPFLFVLSDANNKELFGAEGSRRINPKGNQWVNKDLGK